jgi:chorismate dehydratase
MKTACLPRLGQISFINNLPVVLPIEEGLVDLAADTTYANPAELNSAYAAGLLDIGAMSSFFYLQQKDYAIVPTVSISCLREVGSVLFFSKDRPQSLNGARVAVPSSSATSINLLQVLLLERYGVSLELVVEGKPDINNADYAGALVIGDQALHVDEEWSASHQRVDLGEWWHRDTGLPMVFGVWAAVGSWKRENESGFKQISEALGQSANFGLNEMFASVVKAAGERTGLSHETLHRYYKQQLNYEMTRSHREGLEMYRRLCVKHGLLYV